MEGIFLDKRRKEKRVLPPQLATLSASIRLGRILSSLGPHSTANYGYSLSYAWCPVSPSTCTGVGATLAHADVHSQGRDRSAVVDWRACRFVLIGIAPFGALSLKRALARPPAFWRRHKSPYRSAFIFFSYCPHLLSFYFRGPLNSPASRVPFNHTPYSWVDPDKNLPVLSCLPPLPHPILSPSNPFIAHLPCRPPPFLPHHLPTSL
jgi:hypothetical protein